jgi:preprotein translocase subunit SecA
MYAVCNGFAEQLVQSKDKQAFELEVIQHLAIEPVITDAEITKGDVGAISDNLYHQVKDFYVRKMTALREQMLPVLNNVFQDHGDKVENVSIPFTDGIRGLQIQVPMQDALTYEAHPVIQNLEKSITLAMIDEAWKNHLRSMDDLRQSVRMASYEQKDPLLIYKFEAFNLFKQMMLETNRNIISFMLRAGIPIQDAPPQTAMIPQATDMRQMRVNKVDDEYSDEDYYTEQPDSEAPPVKKMPVQAAPKIGRNDSCPCGSGKKFKNCHGKGI